MAATAIQGFLKNILRVSTAASVVPASDLAAKAAVDPTLVGSTLAATAISFVAGGLLLESKLDQQEQQQLEALLLRIASEQDSMIDVLDSIANGVGGCGDSIRHNARLMLSVIEDNAASIETESARLQSLTIYIGEWLAKQNDEILARLNELCHEDGNWADIREQAEAKSVELHLRVSRDMWGKQQFREALLKLQLLASECTMVIEDIREGSIILAVRMTESAFLKLLELEKKCVVSTTLGCFVESISIDNSRNSQDANRPGEAYKLYVGNLPFNATEEDIIEFFSRAGVKSASDVTIIRDRETGRSRGFGFVTVFGNGDVYIAINELNGSDFGGRSIVINESRPREERRGGGFGRGGYGSGHTSPPDDED